MSAADNQRLRVRNRATLQATARTAAPTPRPERPAHAATAPARPAANTPRRPRDFGQIETVKFPDLGIDLPALCDTGAQVSVILASEIEAAEGGKIRITIPGRNACHVITKKVLTSMDVEAAHGTTVNCPVIALHMILDDYATDVHFAVSLHPLKGGQPVILGDTFFAAAPFQARVVHGESFLSGNRARATKNTAWNSDDGEV